MNKKVLMSKKSIGKPLQYDVADQNPRKKMAAVTLAQMMSKNHLQLFTKVITAERSFKAFVMENSKHLKWMHSDKKQGDDVQLKKTQCHHWFKHMNDNTPPCPFGEQCHFAHY